MCAADGAPELADLLLLKIVRVTGLCVNGEVALCQAGERTDDIGGHARNHARAHQDRVDVPVSVVVREDRATKVVVPPGRLEVTTGREDRVNGVVRILLSVLVGVDAVGPPR